MAPRSSPLEHRPCLAPSRLRRSAIYESDLLSLDLSRILIPCSAPRARKTSRQRGRQTKLPSHVAYSARPAFGRPVLPRSDATAGAGTPLARKNCGGHGARDGGGEGKSGRRIRLKRAPSRLYWHSLEVRTASSARLGIACFDSSVADPVEWPLGEVLRIECLADIKRLVFWKLTAIV
jgi:hypothetical protein